MARKMYIVWNTDKTEGFVTDCPHDAKSATNGRPHSHNGYRSQSTAGLAFFETYEDDAPLKIETVELPDA